MPENNSRAYCSVHKYFATKTWKTPEEAEADLNDHVSNFPEDEFKVQIEERQSAAVLRENLLNQKIFIHSTLQMLSDAASSDPEEIGACRIKLPGGEERCYQLSETQCNKLGGNYVGGEC